MNDNAKAHNREASENDKPIGLLDDKREREEWLKRHESAVGGELQDMTRKAIILAIADQGKSPTDALEEVKERYFEGDEEHPDAQIINKIIESIHSKVPLSAVSEIENKAVVDKAEAFREKLRKSLPVSNEVAKKIENIFDHVKDGYKSGLIPDLHELQTEVDKWVTILGLDENTFSGAINEYAALVPKFEEKD